MTQPQQQKTNNNANNFMNYFNSKVLPITNNIEGYRSKLLIGSIIWAVVVAGFPVLFSFLVLFSGGTLTDKLSIIACFLVPAALAVCAPVFYARKIYAMFFKEKIIPVLLGFWGNYTYVPPINLVTAIYKAFKNKSGFNGFWTELRRDKKTNISVNPSVLARLLRFSSIEYDDKIVGKHNDVAVEFAELTTSYITTSHDSEGKNKSSKHISFKGVVFSAKLNKNFKGVTLVSFDNIDKKRAMHPTIGANAISSMSLTDALNFGTQLADAAGAVKDMVNTAKEMQNQGKSQEEIQAAMAEKYGKNTNVPVEKNQQPLKFDDVHLEDPLFNRKFKMCSTDQIEARYIFTTAFLSRFMKIAEGYNYRLHAVFMAENVYILIDTRGFFGSKNWFEIPFFNSCKDPKNYQEFLNDFTKLLSIVDTLKLNQNIGM